MHKTYKNQTKVYLQSNIIKLIKKPTLYLSVSNLSFIFAIKWHSICITNKYKAVMPQSQKYGGNREQITNKESYYVCKG